MDPQSNNDKTKESFAAYVTRITGIATAISLGGLFLGLPDTIESVAELVARYSIITWIALVGAPIVIKIAWKNRKKASSIKGIVPIPKIETLKQSIQSASESFNPSTGVHNTSTSEAIQKNALESSTSTQSIVYASIPAPLDKLPINPKPVPEGALQEDTAAEFIRNIIQLAGLRMDEDPEILKIDSGPTVQAISFKLPMRMQLSDLVKKREDIANHIGNRQGFSVESSEFSSAVTFVIPQKKRAFVYIRDVAEEFLQFAKSAELPVIYGKDTKGLAILVDLAKLPHLLVAGTTGSGKSVFINTVLESLLSVRSPEKVKLVLIDPKKVELQSYNAMPHLLLPTVVDPNRASLALKKVCVEMDQRYDFFSAKGVRNIVQYNKKNPNHTFPYIVIVIDEYADLVIVAKDDVEDSVQRITQMGRAAGIHLITGTQRPSVDVIGGVIKANMPSRVVFQLSSGHDFRTALDGGNPSLLGEGDGIFKTKNGNLIRFQSAAISVDEDEMDEYIDHTIRYWEERTPIQTLRSDSLDQEDSIEEQEQRHITEQRITYPTVVDVATKDDISSALVESEDMMIEDNQLSIKIDNNEQNAIIEPPKPLDIWDENYEIEEEDEYDRFVSVVEQNKGFSMSIVKEKMNMELSQASMYIERMVKENLLGEFDNSLNMRPYLGDQSSVSKDEESLIIETLKEYICRSRSTRTSEIRAVLKMRKITALELMRKLAEEGFLELPTASKKGYTIAWDEERISEYLRTRNSSNQ